ncbi:hypothetical protein GGI05_002270, partial [Coemansia sp. RSA 2603]
MPLFIVHFAHYHADFRLPELEALSQLENVPISYDAQHHSASSPFLLLTVASAADAAKLVRRAILIRSIIEHWGSGPTYSDVFAQVQAQPERTAHYKHASFRFAVESFGRSLAHEHKISVIESFSFMGFEGPVRMQGAEQEFFVAEQYEEDCKTDGPPEHVWFGRVVGHGSRELIDRFDVKKRKYLGNTTMDAELSLLMANQALARPGALVFDPFVGTGSFLLTCAHFGAFTAGADIDGRQMRGTAGFRRNTQGIQANTAQYGVSGRVL